eukprot:TRINITY_DN59967_c0_g2_i1.p1 TRINITY_DN59967_c0_g2~~TRINITY_DN59967_c0_g2_i1.p1  ORF type:complete len:123 (-),score=5.89 TRINITY_DN59967_c0_g2_i1:233-601(-)
MQALLRTYEGFQRVRLISTPEGKFKGYCFATFDTNQHAAVAREKLKQMAATNYWGQPVEVKFTIQPEKRVKTNPVPAAQAIAAISAAIPTPAAHSTTATTTTSTTANTQVPAGYSMPWTTSR